MQFRKSDKKVLKIFRKENVEPKIEYYKVGKSTIRYVETNRLAEDSTPVLLFIHGAPGSSDNFYDYLSDSSLLKKFRMVSVDRPGYGYSDFGDAKTSIVDQAELLVPLVKKLSRASVLTIVSHSYGGPVSAKIAMDYPEMVDRLVFMAPAIDPNHEKIFWVSYLGKVPPFRWLTPTSFKVATDEKFAHEEALREIESGWDKISAEVIYMHGEKDFIVPFENYNYAVQKMEHLELDTMKFPKENHFIPWTQKEVVVQKLLGR